MKLELGLFSYSYHLAFGAHGVFRPRTQMNLFEFMDRAAEMGLDGVQLDAAHLESTDDAYIDRLRSAASGHGLYLEYGIRGFKAFGVALGDGMIDLQAILDILVTESRLDRIMLEVPVKKEATEEATLAKEDDFVRRSVLYARDVLGIR